jgi:hypothetical protein
MTTLIYIENMLGSGQIVKLNEDFGDYSVSRELKPGEHARLVISPFKSLAVEEVPVTAGRHGVGADRGAPITYFAPRSVERRYG